MQAVNRLTATSIKALTKPGYHADGGNLYLQVAPTGRKSWIFRYKVGKRNPEIGLGPFPLVSLAEARKAAFEQNRLRLAGIDPADARAKARAATKTRASLRLTFKEAAAQYIETHAPGWRGRTAKDWTQTMRDYAEPVIGALDVADIETDHVFAIVSPLWKVKHTTAKNVRSRIENILDWAASRALRTGPNPARYDGHLENLLATHKHVTKHRPALPYREAHEFLTALQTLDTNEARALWLITYTGTRYKEAARAQWKEFDLERRVWTVPADRMKSDQPHEIPLPRQVVTWLQALPGDHKPDDCLFPTRKGTGVANSKINDTLRDIGYAIGEASTHGFRSTLRTWVGETFKTLKKEIAESVISHDQRDKVEQTYERTRFLKARKPIMQAWADYLDAPPPPERDDEAHEEQSVLRLAA